MPLAFLRVVTALAVFTVSAAAQLQFDELPKRHLPPDRDLTYAVAVGDVNGDGHLDLILGNDDQQNRLFTNDGSGVFADATGSLPIDSAPTRALALGDVDGDGDRDLIVGNDGAQNQLYLNDGTGGFADATAMRMPADSDGTYSLVLGDVDGDGDSDLVCGNFGQNRLYLNDGNGAFVDVTAMRLPASTDGTYDLALVDVDGDGDSDLIAGNNRSQNRLYLNDGTGAFTDGTATRMPAEFESTEAVCAGDVDGDGDPDLILGNMNSLFGRQNLLYLNDGTGTFTDATAGRLPTISDGTHDAALDDVDGDGDLDVIFATGDGGPNRQNRLCLNDGSGIFVEATAALLPQYDDETWTIALGDVDADGDPDLVFGNWDQSRVYSNDGGGAFIDTSARRLPGGDRGTDGVALVDVDGDGDNDLVLAVLDGQSRLFLNDGAGWFTDVTATQMPTLSTWTTQIAAGDVDGDGDPDLVLANTQGQLQNRLYLNDGAGTFVNATATRMPVDNDSSQAVAMKDVDGDGDLDVVFGNAGQNRLYLNDGTGTFTDVTATQMPVDRLTSRGIVLGDVDGDGDRDLVFANSRSNRLYLNDGNGSFVDVTGVRMPRDQDITSGVALGDVDGDGDPDLVWATFDAQNRLYLNDGTGTFTDATATRMPPDAAISSKDVAMGDVDGDGAPDLIFGNSPSLFGAPGQDFLYLNDGSGTFTDATAERMPFDDDAAEAVVLGDVTGSGVADLIVGNNGPSSRLYSNLLRQLHVPFLVRPGHPYRFEIYARNRPPRPMDVAAVMVSAGTSRIPLPPLGVFRLDPATTVVLPGAVIPQPAGVLTLSLPVPNLPSLIGFTVHAQALLAQGAVGTFLTNATADRIAQ